MEKGRVLALNFPVGLNPGLARILGVMLKLDFQRAILQRIPQISANPDRTWRDLLFVCDEYHAFATVGETDPTGDERTFALSRQARLIPIVATQSISSIRSALPGDESWRTLLQCFRTKVFLATSDEFTARNAAELCGRRDHLKAHYSVTESGKDAHISLLTGRPASGTAVDQRQQELRAAPRVHLRAAGVHAAPERAGHRAAVRRHQPAAGAVLLPQAALPGRRDQLLRPPGERCAMSSLDRILPFLQPIEDLLRDPAITEVMVNAGGRRVFVERAGAVEALPDRTLEIRNLTVAIKNIARACGDEISERQPILDARLEDGSRVAAMFPPCSVDGPTLTVRKFTYRYTLDDLVGVGTLTGELAADAAARRRCQAQRPHLRRHGDGQDDALERRRADDSRQRPDRAHRRDLRDPHRQAQPGPLRGPAGAGPARPGRPDAGGDHRGPRARDPPAPAGSHPGWGSPRSGGVRPAAGAQHRPPRQPDDDSREQRRAGADAPGALRPDGERRATSSKHARSHHPGRPSCRPSGPRRTAAER